MLPPITTARCVTRSSRCAGGDESSRPSPGLEDLQRLRSPPQARRADGYERDRVAHPPPRLAGHQDEPPGDLGELLDAGGDVDRVADGRVLATPGGAHIADDDRAAMDADAHAQRRLAAVGALRVPARSRVLPGEGA